MTVVYYYIITGPARCVLLSDALGYVVLSLECYFLLVLWLFLAYLSEFHLKLMVFFSFQTFELNSDISLVISGCSSMFSPVVVWGWN